MGREHSVKVNFNDSELTRLDELRPPGVSGPPACASCSRSPPATRPCQSSAPSPAMVGSRPRSHLPGSFATTARARQRAGEVAPRL